MYGHQGGKVVVGGVGGMNWEVGIDMCTLICIKWITNKNVLYKKINKIKFKIQKKNFSFQWLPVLYFLQILLR